LVTVTTQFATDRRGMHAPLLSNTGLAFPSRQAALYLITLALS
jgi:hypothetical protein